MKVALLIVIVLAVIGFAVVIYVLQHVGSPEPRTYEGGWYRPPDPAALDRFNRDFDAGLYCPCKGTGRIDLGGGRELWCKYHPRRR